MNWAIKTHGMIYLGNDSRALVNHVFNKHGQHRVCGELVNGGWAVELERPNMEIVATLERDGFTIERI